MKQDKHKSQKARSIWRVFLRAIISLFAFFTVILLYFCITSLFLHVENVLVQTKLVSPLRIVHLSDLHNAQYGKNNERLIAIVAQQDPDLIIMSGDMLNRDDENTDIVTSLISELSAVAPVFYGYGNHEKAWETLHERSLRTILVSAGAVVMDNDYLDLEIKGNQLRIGGYMGYYPVPSMTTGDKAQQELELAFMEDFENTDRLKILINHIPTSWLDWDCLNKRPVDIVFSGHYHGGVVRIPILNQGLYAPYIGWFPPYTKGVFSGSLATCVLSAGLGNEHHIPRINNPPEILVVDLIPIND